MHYLQITRGAFVVKQSKANFELSLKKAAEIGIDLLLLEDLGQAAAVLSPICAGQSSIAVDISCWRFSYWVERKLLRRLNACKKANPKMECFRAMEDYIHAVNNGTFFCDGAVQKADSIYSVYKASPHLTAKCANELNGHDFSEEVSSIPRDLFAKTFYECAYTDLQVSCYIEHRARLSIMRSAVDYLLFKIAGLPEKADKDELFGLKLMDLMPSSFASAVEELAKHKYFRLYPVFWQWFMWLFGGFILLDYEDQDYRLLSQKTGVPEQEIPNALSAYDLLFPHPGGWFNNCNPNANIRLLKLFSVPFMGVGANYRRANYTKGGQYSDLSLTGKHTQEDLKRWNNLAYEVLRRGTSPS